MRATKHGTLQVRRKSEPLQRWHHGEEVTLRREYLAPRLSAQKYSLYLW